MLPKTKSKPKHTLADLTALMYGPSKIGKSTWCSKADDALFLATEPGLNALEVFQTPITCWDDLLQACAEIAEGKHEFKTIVVDTVDNAYKMCSDYVCKKFKIEHESDLGYGKGYALINNEFQRVINKLAFLPYGLILISHSQERDIETRTGKHTRIVPTLPEKARKLVTGLVDLILFCDLDMKTGEDGKPVWQRVMRTKPSPNYDAGDRTGRLPEVIPLDFSSFMKAFNNTAAGAAGIGPAKARLIVESFGDAFEETLLNDPERIALKARLPLDAARRLRDEWLKTPSWPGCRHSV
jgi:hypothetical protein